MVDFVPLHCFEGIDEVEARVVAPAFAHRVIPLGAGELVMSTRIADARGCCELRSAHLRSEKIEIVTVFSYPDPARCAPTYAMEFVVLGRKPVVAVIDVIDLAEGSAAGPEIMAGTKALAGDPEPETDVPEWFQECRTGHDLFCRPPDLESFARLAAAHDHALAATIEATCTAPELSADAAERHGRAIADYRRHHALNTPGLPLLQRALGEEETEAYLDVVFG